MNPLTFVICLVCAVIAACIAASKGRSVIGWLLGGFFLGLIGIIIVACLSNLKERTAQFERGDRERRRLREQLRQERQKTEAFRQYSMGRLDAHDRTLGVDTRSADALPGADPQHVLTDPSGNAPPQGALPTGPTFSAVGSLWYYAQAGQAQGPVSEAEVKHMVSSGQIDGATMIWTEGLNDWARLDEMPNFRTG